MKFAEVDAPDALGAVLAHSTATAGGRIPKGTVLEESHLSDLEAAGISRVSVAIAESDDVGENETARRVAAALPTEGLRAGNALSGRANLFAACRGLFRADSRRVDEINAIDPSVTLATLPDREHVEPGRLVATVKVIPFAVPKGVVEACERVAGILRVKAYQAARAHLVQTRLPGTKEGMLDKARRVTEARLRQCDATLEGETRCEHAPRALADSMSDALEKDPEIVLVFGASAVCDERDVVPAAIGLLGGEVRRVGMPVDPGNLLVLGRIGRAAVVGLPGCARSPKLNGFDWVLRRLCAGECVASADIVGMGVGGLLDEIHDRPRPRTRPRTEASGPLAAVLLAGGLSTRMGGRNKLLETWGGKPLLQHAAQSLAAARDEGIVAAVVVVTGGERGQVEKLCAGLGFELVHNERHQTGMASSLAKGIGSVPPEFAGAFVCLGDMPLTSAGLLRALAAEFDPAEGRDIVAPVCGGKRGHPVLFGARHFGELRALEGDSGARALLARHEEAIVPVEAGEEALVDFDDPNAFERPPG